MEFTPGIAAIIMLLVSSKLIKTKEHFSLKQSWTYEFKSVEAYSENSDLLKFNNWKVDRIRRGVFALSGSIILNMDVVEGDDNEADFRIYRSENGVKEYKPMPFGVQRQHVYKYMNTFYKELIMESLSKCSNFPVFEDKFEPPLQKRTYTLNQCQFNQEGFPQFIQDGFYKTVINGFGPTKWSVIFITEIQNNK
ncbi:uncharacterized protein [Musca autumnalis]|uniref:uncharacterized protein n=1 Tax=Musca autumnalis TaxID=221902 RepID=UPI003CF543FA